jgi:hypothetical protein
VTINRNDLKNKGAGEKISAKELIVPPEFRKNPKSSAYNYGLIVLNKATTQDVTPIRLGKASKGMNASVMGWSRNQVPKGADSPWKLNLNVISNAKCSKKGGKGWKTSPRHMCTVGKMEGPYGPGGCKVVNGKYETGVKEL